VRERLGEYRLYGGDVAVETGEVVSKVAAEREKESEQSKDGG
jgi:hypothetical protein